MVLNTAKNTWEANDKNKHDCRIVIVVALIVLNTPNLKRLWESNDKKAIPHRIVALAVLIAAKTL